MKHLLSLLATSAVFAICSLLQTGCAGGYAVGAPGYGPYAPYGGAYYGGVGFYRGAYYGNSAYWNGGPGYAYGARGGSATWNNGSGSATGWRGSTASWNNGSGSASGFRGGSASWGRLWERDRMARPHSLLGRRWFSWWRIPAMMAAPQPRNVSRSRIKHRLPQKCPANSFPMA